MSAVESKAKSAVLHGGYRLPRIPYLRLRFTLRSEEDAVLPPYKGSLLRGAFGHALRAAVCAFGPEQACAVCRLRRECVYTRLFETFVESAPPPFLRGLPTSPRPYVFEPDGEVRRFPRGAPLGFDLVLLGQAVHLQAHAVLAVERMARHGLGCDRRPFSLAGAGWLDADGCCHDLTATAGSAADPVPAACVRADAPPRQAVLHFLTPTRIKLRDRLAPSVGMRALAFAMLRRVLELAHFHVPGAEVDWTFRPLLEHAGGLRVVAAELRWHDWERYSNRQRTRMALGGFVGRLAVEGDLAPLWPLLRTAEVVHVGKGATFGLGRMEIES